MRDDYQIKGAVTKIEVEVEKDVAEKLSTMSAFTKLSLSEITNTALKRFISSHKDFLPAEAKSKN